MIKNINFNKDSKYSFSQYIKKIYLKFISFSFFLLSRITPFFYTFHIRPKKKINMPELRTYYKFKIGIVIQGKINNFKYTFDTIKFYLENFSNVAIILSTWKDLSIEQINLIKNLKVYIIENIEPINKKNWLGGNLNAQIISTKEGIKLAKNIGCDYVLKTRVDQRIYSNNIFHHLINLLEVFPVKNIYKVFLKQRIITINFDAPLFECYRISDMLQFGQSSDLLNFWDVDLFVENDLKNISLIKKNIFTHSYLTMKFLKKNNINCKWSMLDSFRILSELFCIVDKEFFDLHWNKYDCREYRWKSYKNPRQTFEINFYFWLSLYKNYKLYYKANKSKINLILKQNLKQDIWSQ
jgi:hypothetical protein